MRRFLAILRIYLLILHIKICLSQTSSLISSSMASSYSQESAVETSSPLSLTPSASSSSTLIIQTSSSNPASSESTLQFSSSSVQSMPDSLAPSSSVHTSITHFSTIAIESVSSLASPVPNLISNSMMSAHSTSTGAIGMSSFSEALAVTMISSEGNWQRTTSLGQALIESTSLAPRVMTVSSSARVSTSSSSISTPLSSSAAPPQPNPSATYQPCQSNDNPCKNYGGCFVNNARVHICVCTGDYYGPKCDKEANPLFKPLVYAFGGSTGFLLVVICIALIITCKRNPYKSGSEDLDNFNNIGLRAKGTSNDGVIIE